MQSVKCVCICKTALFIVGENCYCLVLCESRAAVSFCVVLFGSNTKETLLRFVSESSQYSVWNSRVWFRFAINLGL